MGVGYCYSHRDVAFPAKAGISHGLVKATQEDRNYEDDRSTGNVGSALRSHDFNSLDHNVIYAIQLKYDLQSSPNITRVYSARDVYVWPAPPSDQSDAKQFPGQMLATYQFFGRWPDATLDYVICQNTFFPVMDKEEWADMIKHTLDNWEAAAEGLITVNDPTVKDCQFPVPIPWLPNLHLPGTPSADDVPLGMALSIFNGDNEVYMVNTPLWGEDFKQWAKIPTNPLFACVFLAPACVLSSAYYHSDKGSGLELHTGTHHFLGIPLYGIGTGSTDTLINRKRLSSAHSTTNNPRNLPGRDDDYDENDVRFNTCLLAGHTQVNERNTDQGIYYLYSTMLHEGGHMLGLSGFDLKKLAKADYEMSHPTIPDTVMNYDYEVSLNTSSETIRWEPDCSPHPFDLMALHILYQTQ